MSFQTGRTLFLYYDFAPLQLDALILLSVMNYYIHFNIYFILFHITGVFILQTY